MSMNNLLYPSSYVKADSSNVPVWYEFLLKQELLPRHLLQLDPDPSGCSLIKQFFDQANRPFNDQGQILPPQDNERNKALKTLSLQAAALLKWDLSVFEKELPITTRHQLLTELMKACKVSFPVAPQNELGAAIEKLHDHSVMSVVLFCCWGTRTIVKSTFPCKPGGRITPTVPQSVPYQANAQQRSDEIRDQIIAVLKDQVGDIVQFLEAVLHHVKRPIYLPSYNTFTSQSVKLDEDPAGIKVCFEELHAQICYDLGCMHFTHNFYEKAEEMFGHVSEWLQRIPEERSRFCVVDESRLNGYRTACSMINKKTDDEESALVDDNLFLKIKSILKIRGSALRELGEIIIEDIYKKELSTAFLDDLERELELNQEKPCGSDTIFDVKWCNAVRRATSGLEQPTGLWTFDMNVAQLQRVIGFVQQISAYVSHDEGERLGSFLFSLANNLTDRALREQLLNFEVTRRLISADNLYQLQLRLSTPCLRPLVLENESPASPEAMTSSPRVTQERISELEKTLLMSFEPRTIKDTLSQLHAASSGRRYYNLCSQWELSGIYVSTITTSTTDAMPFDLFYVLFAKARHCYLDRDFGKAKSLLSYVHNNCNSNEEVKLKRLAGNELLKVELLDLLNDESLLYVDREECAELRGQLSDVVVRCRHILSSFADVSKQSGLPSHLIRLCTAMLLNLEDLSFSMEVSRSASSAPCVRLSCLVASVRSGIVDRTSEARKAASELWSASMGIFASMSSSNGSGGRTTSKKSMAEPLRNLLPPNALISRPSLIQFIKLIKNPSILQIFVSLLVHLHRLCRTDILSDITCPDSGAINELWPTGLDGTPLSGPCVTLALRETLSHCVSLQPDSQAWLRTLADLHYAFSNYDAALKSYLLLGAFSSNYFNQISSTGPYDDEHILQRLIKCCMQMKCYTQAAVLCQLTKDIDYATAFKALQEHRDRTDAAEMHYLDHIWDVQILEHAAFEHRESGESLNKNAAVSATSRPELNHSNSPQVGARVKAFRKARFFRAMARQYLC